MLLGWDADEVGEKFVLDVDVVMALAKFGLYQAVCVAELEKIGTLALFAFETGLFVKQYAQGRGDEAGCSKLWGYVDGKHAIRRYSTSLFTRSSWNLPPLQSPELRKPNSLQMGKHPARSE